jgi:hypothetical protein
VIAVGYSVSSKLAILPDDGLVIELMYSDLINVRPPVNNVGVLWLAHPQGSWAVLLKLLGGVDHQHEQLGSTLFCQPTIEL